VAPARPTIRCLAKDLEHDWSSVEDKRSVEKGNLPRKHLHLLAHPIIQHVRDLFSGELSADISRESISGLPASHPPFWKGKTGRWRGAVYEDADGQGWLCAAGLRREGEGSDFYAEFMSGVAADLDKYLPTEEDRQRLALELAELAVGNWEKNVVGAVLDALTDAAESGSADRDIPSLDPLQNRVATLTVDVETTGAPWDPETAPSEPAEVAVQLSIKQWQDPALVKRLQVLVVATILPDPQAWDAAPEAIGQRLLVTLSRVKLRQLTESARMPAVAHPASDLGTLESATRAHYAPRAQIVDAIVSGEPVQAMCGVYFVPNRDPSNLPVCDRCEGISQVVGAPA
jgi:Protein of unknown function (DUF3039)